MGEYGTESVYACMREWENAGEWANLVMLGMRYG